MTGSAFGGAASPLVASGMWEGDIASHGPLTSGERHADGGQADAAPKGAHDAFGYCPPSDSKPAVGMSPFGCAESPHVGGAGGSGARAALGGID